MSGSRIINVKTPEQDSDSANKKYVDDEINDHWHRNPHKSVGRYIAIPHGYGTNTYFSVRTKKNIRLDNGIEVSIKYDNNDSGDFIVNHAPLLVILRGYCTPEPYF